MWKGALHKNKKQKATFSNKIEKEKDWERDREKKVSYFFSFKSWLSYNLAYYLHTYLGKHKRTHTRTQLGE